MRIGVPMNAHKRLHDGHRELLNYVRGLGDNELVAFVLVDPQAIYEYYRSGRIVKPSSVNVSEMRRELSSLGIEQKYFSLSNGILKYETRRQSAYEKAKAMIDPYSDLLLDPGIKMDLTYRMMGKGLFRQPTKVDAYAFGLELRHLFRKNVLFKDVGKTADIYIYKNLIRSKEHGLIENSSLLSKIHEHDRDQLCRMASASLGARDRFKVGRNDELVKELNLSYPHRCWTFHRILVWEADWVEGRYELVQFMVRSKGGSVIIEDIFYEG
jgi:hypothetical protein